MATFYYTARDRDGTVKTGQVESLSEDDALAVLQNRGLIVTGIESKGMADAAAVKARSSRLHGRVTADDKVLFCQQLATLLNAGIPLLRSLEILAMQVESQRLLDAIQQIRKDIEGGKTFRDALAKHPKIFTQFWVNLVETGEASGHLAESLNQLAQYLESVRFIQGKAMTAMMYPLVLIVGAIVALGFFVFKIIPTFQGIFAAMNIPLPPLTVAVLSISNFVRRYVLLIGAVGGALVYGLNQFLHTDRGRELMDHFVLRLPVLNRLLINLQLAQFSRGLGALLESGVPILFAMEIMGQSATNTAYRRAIEQIRHEVQRGKTVAEPMSQFDLFPPMMVQMVRVGEEIGELGKMLDRVAKYYEQRVATFIERMTTLFEPIAIVVMALVIGTLVVAMFLPIFNISSAFGR